MIKYFLSRLLAVIPKLIIITIIVFSLMQLIPGNPLSYTIPPDVYGRMKPGQMEEMMEAHGLNDPAVVRYFRWVGNLITGDLGYSLRTKSPISGLIATRLPATIEVVAYGFLVATILGVLFGFLCAIKRNTALDYGLTALGMVGVSIPEFFFGMMVIQLFTFNLKWLPSGGRFPEIGREGFFDRLPHMIMPVMILGIVYTATLMRYTRASMLDTMNKDYVKAARSKGLSDMRVNFVHSFRNALIPSMIIMANRIPQLISGMVVIESVFAYPGMGTLLTDSVKASDMPVVMITILFVALAVLAASFIIDIVSALLDPRIRFGAE